MSLLIRSTPVKRAKDPEHREQEYYKGGDEEKDAW